MEKNKRWEDMDASEKADFLRQEDRHLYDTIIKETRHLADLISRQAKRIDDLQREIAEIKQKAKDQNILLG